jgi:hypothetical protein
MDMANANDNVRVGYLGNVQGSINKMNQVIRWNLHATY